MLYIDCDFEFGKFLKGITMQFRRLTLAAPALAISLLASSAFSLTDKQQEELRQYGTVTVYNEDGSKKGHFEVKFMPGSVNIARDAQKRWERAADLMDDFVDANEFWREKFIGSFNDGVEYIRKGVEGGVFKIPEDFKDTLKENREIDGNFGATAAKVKNWISFGLMAGGRVLRTVWGIGAGGIYAVVTPVGHVLYRPIAAGTNALVAGTLWPIVKYTWNGTAWVMVKNNNEPKAGDMTVTFIPETIADHELNAVEEAI